MAVSRLSTWTRHPLIPTHSEIGAHHQTAKPNRTEVTAADHDRCDPTGTSSCAEILGTRTPLSFTPRRHRPDYVRPMERSDIVIAFSDPASAGIVPAPVQGASPARRLRDAIEPIAMHSVWAKQTNDRLDVLGLDFMGAYVQSRAALLGRPEPGVVTAAFAVFEPTMIQGVFERDRDAVAPDVLLAARLESTTASLTTVLDLDAAHDADDVEWVATKLQGAASGADGTGRPLFSGLAGRPWPDEPVARLWRACEQLREHRGDGHVAVCVANGLDPVQMNVLTEVWLGMPLGSYSGTRGWSEERIAQAVDDLGGRGLMAGDRLTDDGRRFRDRLETTTDDLERPVVDALGSDLDVVVERLDAWSARCVEAGQFPDDPFKRAAG